MMTIITKVIIVVSVIVVGIFDIDFEPQDLVAPSGHTVVKANLDQNHDDDEEEEYIDHYHQIY